MRRQGRGVCRFFLLFLLAILSLAKAETDWAQSGKVTISGRVTDCLVEEQSNSSAHQLSFMRLSQFPIKSDSVVISQNRYFER